MEKISKKKLLKCFEEIVYNYSMSKGEFLKIVQNPKCDQDKKVVYPESPIILEKDDKIYITNLKCMLADNLYNSKTGSIIKLQPKTLNLIKAEAPPVGWWVSEKLDGIRAIWDGEKFLSRASASGLGSKVYSYVPNFFTNLMPKGVALDGEIWMGRGMFNNMSSISNWIPGKKFTKEQIDAIWAGTSGMPPIKYKVFDIPNSSLPFEERMKELDKIILNVFNCCRQKNTICPIEKVESIKVKTPEQLQEIYYKLTKDGAEGVMLRAPNSPYETKRSQYLLKYKIKEDAEGIVIDRISGTGRLQGLLGSLKVELIKNGERTGIFTNIGTGFSDEQRTNNSKDPNYIPIDTIVSFSYMELTEDSVRHPAFRGIRTDVIRPVSVKLDDYKEYMIIKLKNLIDDVEKEKDSTWMFKKKQYLNALGIITKYKDPIKNVEELIVILRNNGMKFDKEEEYFAKNKEYKSAILKKIDYMIKTGDLPKQSEESQAISNLIKIPEIGESKARKLYTEYGIINISELKSLYEKNPDVITSKQAIGLKYYEDLSERIPREEMNKWYYVLFNIYNQVVKEINPDNAKFEIVGSYRRKSSSSGDIDVLLTSETRGKEMMKLFKKKLIDSKIIESEQNIFAAGDTKIMTVAKIESKYRHLDIFYHPINIYPFALLHSTGSAEFNPELRSLFLNKGYSLSEKGIKKGSPKGPDLLSKDIEEKIGKKIFETEKDIFDFIGIKYIDPENRRSGILL